MKKSSITLLRISVIFAVSSVYIIAENVYFRMIKDSSSTDNCSDFVGREGTAVSAAICGADCSWHGQCRGFLYDPVTTACKDVYRDNITYPECQADDGDDFYIEVCDRFLVSGPFGVPDSQLYESTNWCNVMVPNETLCQPPGPHRPTSAKYARLNSTGMLTGAWIAGIRDQQQHVEVDFLTPRTVTKVVMQARDQVMLKEERYVKSFKFLHSDDCIAYEELMGDSGYPFILEGNSNTYETVVRDLPRRVKARCFRINPVSWLKGISMRFDLMGCP